jgi:hypothetical protein
MSDTNSVLMQLLRPRSRANDLARSSVSCHATILTEFDAHRKGVTPCRPVALLRTCVVISVTGSTVISEIAMCIALSLLYRSCAHEIPA